MRRQRLMVLLVPLLLLTGCVGAPSVSTPKFDPALLPALPAAAPAEGTDPSSKAASLAAGTDDSLPATESGWVRVYGEFGIPIIDDRAKGDSADPVGPHWAQVWALAGLSRGAATVPLTDAATILFDARAESLSVEAILAQWRTASVGPDVRLATLSRFIAAKSVANGGADPLDAKTVADGVRLDAATLQLIAWETLRQSLLRAPTPGATPSSAPNRQIVAASVVEKAAVSVNESAAAGGAAAPCSELWGTQDQTSWINWVANKVGGPAAEKLAGETIGKFLAKANIIATVLALIAQVNALEVTTTTDPSILVRDRQAQDGGQAQLGFRLAFNASILNSNNQALCALVTASNALGVGLALPADGSAVSGAEIKLEPIKNFPDKIYFNDTKGVNFTKIVTNGEGVATAYTQGHKRATALPESAKEKPDEYGFAVSAQVEEAGAQSILNLFIDGLSVAGGGAIGGILDAVKLYHFDLGEQYFPFIDYETGYRVEQVWLQGYRVSGLVCDLERPFQLQLNGDGIPAFTGPLLFNPAPDGTFSYMFQGLFGGIAAGVGNGHGYSTVTDTDAKLFLDGGYWTAAVPLAGIQPIGPNGQHLAGAITEPIILKPDPDGCTR